MTDQLKQLREQIEQIEAEKILAWRKHSGATYAAGANYHIFEAAASNAKKAAHGAQLRVEQLRADDTMYPEGRKRLIREAIEKAKAETQKQLDIMESALLILQAELSVAGVPRLDPKREAPAREELRMLLDGSRDPVSTLLQVAQGDDELAAVACSSYAESYLRAKGTSNAKEAAQNVRAVAVKSAHKSVDPVRQAVGVALAELGTLEQARACTTDISRNALQAAEEAAAGL